MFPLRHYQKPEQTFWPTQHLVVNPTKYVQELYEENYKAVMEEIKEEINYWRYIPSYMDKKVHG